MANETPALTAARLGFATTLARLAARRPLLAFACGLALAAVAGRVELGEGAAGAVDRSLQATFRIVVPLVGFALARDAVGGERLRDAAWPAARFGLARRDVALGIAAATALAAAAASALLAVAAVIAAHGPVAPPLARDALTSAWIGALAGAAYAGWYTLGATFFRSGRGRAVPLVADLFFGGSAGLLGALLPRGNAINLLGGAAPLDLAQPQSAALLAVMAVVLPVVAALRCKR